MKLFGTVYAHCDVPCGIYETDTMTHAAQTCKVMAEKALAIGEEPTPDNDNNFIRMIMTKERHAQRVKHELAVLWGDYFKPEHLEKYPDLHDTIWRAMKQASAVKQHLDVAACDELIAQVKTVADIFAATKR
ncbi:MAG: superoxide dismutase, Ni [Candidatus Saccharimonadales bacterium]